MRMYAYRKYELPVNLDRVNAKLYMSSWKRSHTNSGWWVVNPFFGMEVGPEPGPAPEDY